MTSWPSPALPARLAAARHLPLVGRRPELEALERLWVDVEAGRRQLVFVGGEPGAGKTRLMAEVAGALHDNDVAVLVGTCSLDAAIPYQPFAEMLDQLFTGVPAGSLHDALGDGGPQLRRLSAHAVRHRPELAEEVLEGGDTRVELFDAVAQLLGTLARDRPVTLILDDLHWAQLPTLALLEHLVQAGHETRLLVLATFRTTAPDRSEEVAARVAELHRLEDVRRLDLAGLDTDAITEYVSLRSGLPLNEARPSAAVLRDRTGGNPFFLRETWADLERRGGVTALRLPSGVPASIGDTLAARIGGLGSEDQRVIELAAVLGDTFDLATLVAAGEADRTVTMAFVDAAMAVGLIEAVDADAGVYSFVHALTRQAVVDRMSGSRRSELHARAAQALERQPLDAPLVPRIAQHYLASHILGFHEEALRYSQQAGRLAERSLAFEDAAVWFERAAALPQCAPADRAEMLLAAAAATVRAGQFPRARVIYEQLESMADAPVRLAAAIGFEDATWRPGLVGPRAADLLSTALDECGLAPDDPRYIRALASLGRALALAGETVRARQVGDRAVELAEHLGDEDTLLHALTTAMWAGTAPDVAGRQATRTAAVQRMARARRNYEALGSAANFRATVSYLLGRPDDLEEAFADGERSIQATGQAYYRGVAGILAHSIAFLRGDFEGAEHWAQETFKQNEILGDQMTEGPTGSRPSWCAANAAPSPTCASCSTAASRSPVSGCRDSWPSTPSSG